MERTKKDGRAFYINMDRTVWERLEAYCQKTGAPKTVAIERLLTKALDEELGSSEKNNNEQ